MSDILKRDIRFVWIPNQLEKDGRVEIRLPYENGKKLRAYLEEFDPFEAGMKFDYEKFAVLSSRDGRVDNKLDECVPQGGDEILVLKEIKDPISIIIGVVVAAIAYGGFSAGVITAIALGALAAFAVYSVTQKPRQPSYGNQAQVGGGGSFDESSPTYGWDGIQSYQDVGTAVPVVYGLHRKGGNIINQYVFDDGDKQYLNVLMAMCEGMIEAISGIEINENPASNFFGVSTFFRLGTNDQTMIEGFDQLHDITDISANLLKDDPYSYTTSDTTVEAFEVHLLFPAGLYEQSGSGGMLSASVDYKMEYKEHSSGTWIDLGTQTINATSRTAVRRKFRKEGLTPGQYDIRITKLSEDTTTMKVTDMKLDKIDEIRNDALVYPNTALLALKLLASDQLSGGVPNITGLVQGLKIKTYAVMNGATAVPYEDYYWDAAAQTFKLLADDTELTWDGTTYVTAFSANPAWCMYDLIINNRYGLGDYVAESVMDLPLFLEMAKYCDEKVPKGDSTDEKRFRMDVTIDSDRSALDILNQLAATFRAWPFYSAGAVKLRIDKPENPVQLFAMGNILANTFSQSWKTLKDIPNMVEVQYLDAAKNYEQEMVAYIDEASLEAGNPVRKKTVRLFLTGMSRAIREARYALLVAKYIHRTVTFKAAIDGIACQAGDVISVAHELPQWSFSGRVVSGELNNVTLDKPVTLEAGISYKVRVRHNDDSVDEKVVTNAAGVTSNITISGTFTTAPAQGALWVVGESGVLKKDFRIVQIRKDNKNEIEFTAIEYNTNVYDDTAPDLPNSNFTDPTAGIPSVRDLALTERIAILGDGTVQNIIDVWFNKPDLSSYPFNSYDFARIYISDDDGVSWTLKGETAGNVFSISDGLVEGETYKVFVTTVTKTGVEKSISLCPSASITLVGKAAPPSNVAGFAVSFALDHIHFLWTHIIDADKRGYEIRELPSVSAGWNLGVPISAEISDNTFDYFNLSVQGNRYFAIKAIDTSGNYSTNMTTASLLINQIPEINVIETVDFDLAQGSLTGDAERVMNVLYNAAYYRTALALAAVKEWDDSVNWWDVLLQLWDEPVKSTAGIYVSPTVDLLGVTTPNISLVMGIQNDTGGSVQIEIAYSDDDSAPTNWTAYSAGMFSGRYFRFRVTFSSTSGDSICIYQLKAIFDVPDKEEQALNVDVAGTGWTTITLQQDYIAIKGLIVSVVSNPYTLEHDQANLPVSFNVKLKDAAGVQQAGKINYFAKGY